MDAIADVLSTTTFAEVTDATDWAARHARCSGIPFDRAIRAGASMDRIGYAFASGYREALSALFELEDDEIASLAVTEEGGGHPRAIHAELVREDEGYRLTGAKKWATLTPPATTAFVAVRLGERDGRPDLAVVRVPLDRAGVVVEPGAATAFVPEVAHASLVFDRVRVAGVERLPGDGYQRYIKPFRTVEDVFVHAAVVAHLVAASRAFDWPQAVTEGGLALLVVLRPLAAADPASPTTHVALAGALPMVHRWMALLGDALTNSPPEYRARFDRDRPLFQVAAEARLRRREAAWRAIR